MDFGISLSNSIKSLWLFWWELHWASSLTWVELTSSWCFYHYQWDPKVKCSRKRFLIYFTFREGSCTHMSSWWTPSTCWCLNYKRSCKYELCLPLWGGQEHAEHDEAALYIQSIISFLCKCDFTSSCWNPTNLISFSSLTAFVGS